MADLPGTPDRHQKITPACRRRPNEELRMEVRDHVEESVSALLDTYDQDDDVTIHVAVTVER
jgi:ribosomal protein L21E